MSGRCELTDLLAAECAHCRRLPDLDVEERTSSVAPSGGWIEARYPGRCAECGEWFDPGAPIRRWADGPIGWVAQCCGGAA
jgi:hypothetical protein